MPDLDLIDRLVATYRILNHTVRLKPEADLVQGNPSTKAIIRGMRDEELRFSQELKSRISGQQIEIVESADQAGLHSTESPETTAALIAQFGTARESTLSMLRTLPDDQWDVTGDYPRSIRTDLISLIDRDRTVLDTIGKTLGEPLVEAATV
ncbi:MAG TPA: hypothetical protein VFI12_09315 [Thermomicrobiales bacterium]|jgi:hypothetical protein|nr:hypothetical protein [Thermomicrobiales bacterium]